ncbi:hypothetical protein TNCV_4371101 [Trichonephila clavipes]|nr:hypothetical protein TNCV_4371101 [Trichonephila clavipes]
MDWREDTSSGVVPVPRFINMRYYAKSHRVALYCDVHKDSLTYVLYHRPISQNQKFMKSCDMQSILENRSFAFFKILTIEAFGETVLVHVLK